VTLVELMVALALAGVTAAFLLTITRTQLVSFELHSQINKAQHNGRAALNNVEQLLRRTCGAISLGNVGVNLPGQTPRVTECLRVFDGAQLSGGSFINGLPSASADAVEVIYGTSPMTRSSALPVLGAAPSVDVVDVSGFSVGDFALLTDFSQADLFQISAITPGVAPGGTLIFATPGGSVVTPSVPVPLVLDDFAKPNITVMKARSFSLYVEQSPPYAGMLMYDPDGMLGTTHADAQPLAEGVADFQVAVGIDGNGDGIVTESIATPASDEWLGNAVGEIVQPVAVTPWNRSGTLDPQLRALRVTLLTATSNVYPGATPSLGPFENRVAYPSTSGGAPRFRSLRITVTPRVWNLLN
jgi:hypothetical protein